jgi:triacylglycerol esterase/lipase EstA (alpha/beta hydrolase family)
MSAAAARLDAVIDRLRRARREPGLRVNLVAHSAGGLVVRHFIRFGAHDVLDQPLGEVQSSFAGAGKVRRVTLIATPNNGSELGLRVVAHIIPPDTLRMVRCGPAGFRHRSLQGWWALTVLRTVVSSS